MTFVNDTSRSPRAQVRPIAIERVELEGFVRRYQDLMKSTSLALQYEYLESSGRIDNFRKAIGSIEGDFTGWFFNDSDIYKWIEAASYSLAYNEDSEIRTRIDSLITLIESVQKKSEGGYVNTYFTGKRASEKWKDLKS
ncbi:MAG TPA: glycoside hydrolase family 127 protein, partial [Mesotoga infera]|nr:glycoside hydrolase family 127 protein [Mesotoga infera]